MVFATPANPVMKITSKKKSIKWTEISLILPSVKLEGKESLPRLSNFNDNNVFGKGTGMCTCLYKQYFELIPQLCITFAVIL